jgi:hypothetical protein
MSDAEQLLRGSKRPLVLGMGGGGDIVGALATAEHARIYDRAEPIVGGVTWERRPIDPVAGPRSVDEIVDALELAPAILLAGPGTKVRDRDVYFAESRMAAALGQQTVLIDVNQGPQTVADGLATAAHKLDRDLIVFVDVGGDLLAQGDEPGLRSPLCDALMLAVASRLSDAGHPVLAAIFGVGCDAELTPEEVFARLSDVAAAGGFAGARGLTEPVVQRLEQAMELVPTEASAQAVHAYRGASGRVTIRGGTRTLELTPSAAVTFYLDVAITMRIAGKLAKALNEATSLQDANAALNALGVRTELDLESQPVRP